MKEEQYTVRQLLIGFADFAVVLFLFLAIVWLMV